VASEKQLEGFRVDREALFENIEFMLRHGEIPEVIVQRTGRSASALSKLSRRWRPEHAKMFENEVTRQRAKRRVKH
jgi:hypothetical protein